MFYRRQHDEGSIETSVSHAAFITAYARLELYNELEKLQDRVLYFDTDSIIFISRPNTYQPKLGNFLGQLTNELENDDFIVEFVSAGPKNYGYRTNKGISKCVVKGFSFYAGTNNLINFDSIKNIVMNNQHDKIATKQMQFKTNKVNWNVESCVKTKLYSMIYDKRILLSDDMSTLPFGYKYV